MVLPPLKNFCWKEKVRMRKLFGMLFLGVTALAHADAIDDLQAGQDVDFDLQGMTYTYTGAQSGSGIVNDGDAPPGCIPKNVGTLNFVLDGAVLGFSGISIPMMGSKVSATRVRWTTDTALNQCITVNLNGTDTQVLIRRVSGRLTANGANVSPFFDSVCGRGYNVGLDDTESDADSFIDVEAYAFCVQNLFTRINLRFRTVRFIGYGGVSRGNVAANTFAWITGEALDGGLTEVSASDDARANALSDGFTLAAEAEVVTAAPDTSQSVVRFHLESRVARLGLSQTIRVFRYDTAQWVIVGGTVATPEDSIASVVLPGLGTNYIQSTDREMKARVRYEPINDEDPALDGWLHEIDLARWSVEP